MRNLIFIFLLIGLNTFAQKPQSYSSSDILLSLKKAQTYGNVLYVAAHPDDENTRLITWLANEKHLNTAYLSITRGDGGQNLIGPEIREQLGIIRTQELQAARRTDGGIQYFTRANDFGFSKNPEETFTIWDREQVLADMVWVIRKFRPDIMITRFTSEPSETHGHHTASAILAAEAFEAAGNKNRFPEQLKDVEIWQPKALYWNTSWWFYGSEANFKPEGLLKVDVGSYNSLLGKSYSEIAAESRSMHKSQGFGSSGARGSAIEYLKPLKGITSAKDLLDGIETSSKRAEGAEKVNQLLAKAELEFKTANPSSIISILIEAYKATETIKEVYWKSKKQSEIKELIKACAGLYLEVAANDYNAVAGQKLDFNIEAVNRSLSRIKLQSVVLKELASDSIFQKELSFNEKLAYKTTLTLPKTMAYSQPYWLEKEGSLGMFNIDNQHLVGLPENPSSLNAVFNLDIEGLSLQYGVPVVYKMTDPVDGEVYKPIVITPEVFVKMAEQVYLFNGNATKKIEVKVKAGKANVQGNVRLQLPKGWTAEPNSQSFSIALKGDEQGFTFEIKSPEAASEGYIKAIAEVSEKHYHQSLTQINYDHIPLQTLFPEAKAKVVKLSLAKKGKTLGYVMGAGDDIPANLEQIGYEVKIIDPKTIQPLNLVGLDAIIMGVRAYNTVEELKFAQTTLLEYVEKGGNLIVQYNTNSRLVTDRLAPYPIKIGRDRVTVENAPVKFELPNHPVLNVPNKITQVDFEGWVQERGLYFASEYAPEFEAILSSHDPGEADLKGGLLIAKYGKGNFIYTGYSWFRQLPAGVPGAYKLFVNMISLGK